MTPPPPPPPPPPRTFGDRYGKKVWAHGHMNSGYLHSSKWWVWAWERLKHVKQAIPLSHHVLTETQIQAGYNTGAYGAVAEIYNSTYFFPVQISHRSLARNYELVGNGVSIWWWVLIGVEFDAECNAWCVIKSMIGIWLIKGVYEPFFIYKEMIFHAYSLDQNAPNAHLAPIMTKEIALWGRFSANRWAPSYSASQSTP